ncbi:hypothetical protein [Lyngbya sp. CCY1209]|nr:hypothetical protein [Lyngbya sp. CCY1209]MEB3886941.1 hypothetical protein [Lyngbya sp. CCY1209]
MSDRVKNPLRLRDSRAVISDSASGVRQFPLLADAIPQSILRSLPDFSPD